MTDPQPADTQQPTTGSDEVGQPPQAKLYCNANTEQPELQTFAGGSVCVFTKAEQSRTTPNEDSAAVFHCSDGGGVLAVADGMGGHAAGDAASRAAIELLIGAVEDGLRNDLLLRSAIINGFEDANRAIDDLELGAGSTLAVAEITGATARAYHCGDSIVLLVSKSGQTKLLTTAHSTVGFGLEAGLLDEDSAMYHEERHILLNALGDEAMRIEVGSPVTLSSCDTLLLASDGLTDNLTLEQIIDEIRASDLRSAVGKLVRDCLDTMQSNQAIAKPDDLTVVAYRHGDS